MVIFSISVLAGIVLAFVSLFFLKDGLPDQLVGVKGVYSPNKPMREYYRSPGYLLWGIGLAILNVGWLGTTIIRTRLHPEMLVSFPVDYVIIAAGLAYITVATVFFHARAKDTTPSGTPAQPAGWLRRQFRGPGFRVACIGAIITCAGLLTLIFTRLI